MKNFQYKFKIFNHFQRRNGNNKYGWSKNQSNETNLSFNKYIPSSIILNYAYLKSLGWYRAEHLVESKSPIYLKHRATISEQKYVLFFYSYSVLVILEDLEINLVGYTENLLGCTFTMKLLKISIWSFVKVLLNGLQQTLNKNINYIQFWNLFFFISSFHLNVDTPSPLISNIHKSLSWSIKNIPIWAKNFSPMESL